MIKPLICPVYQVTGRGTRAPRRGLLFRATSINSVYGHLITSPVFPVVANASDRSLYKKPANRCHLLFSNNLSQTLSWEMRLFMQSRWQSL